MTSPTPPCPMCLVLQDQRDRAWEHLREIWLDNPPKRWWQFWRRRAPAQRHRFVDAECVFCHAPEAKFTPQRCFAASRGTP